MISKRFLSIATSVAVAIAAILAVTALTLSQNKNTLEPAPHIMALYNGQEYSGSLQGYNWKGKVFPVIEPVPATYNASTFNVTYGSSIQFTAKNVTEQPTYYILSARDITVESPSNYGASFILDQVRLDGNNLNVSSANNFELGKKYALSVVGNWIYFDLTGKHQDIVGYVFFVYTIR